MTIQDKINIYNYYKQIALSMDLCTIGINLCVLIVLLLQINKEDKKVRNGFFLYITLILLTISSEMVAWCLLFNVEQFTLYKIFVTIDYFFIWLVPAAMFYLINGILEYKMKLNKTFSKILMLLFLMFGSLILIPPFRDLVLSFNDKIGCYTLTIFSYYYFLIETILVLIGIVVGLVNAKKVGTRDIIIAISFMFGPLFTIYLDDWWASTIGMLFMSLFLIVLFGITYQKKLIIAREKEKEKQIELVDTKMKLLLSQIQPHFLFNTLTTLKFLCETSPMQASELCDTFSEYLRTNIDAVDDTGLIPFEKELKNIENYLKIEKCRFLDRVNYKFDIQVKDFMVPVLSLQPIVENAVKKGICLKSKGGTITIKTRELNDLIEIVFIDDGVGFDVNKYFKDGKNHVGLTNTKKRLELIGGSVKVESKINEGTTVTILVPKGE